MAGAGKFDPIKMAELVRVEEGDGELVLVFRGGGSVRITVEGGGLVSRVSAGQD